MYLISRTDSQDRIEASLGGLVTVEEAMVFADDLLGELGKGRVSNIDLDYSCAKAFGDGSSRILVGMQERALEMGVDKIRVLARDEDVATRLTGARLQQVLEGREEYTAA